MTLLAFIGGTLVGFIISNAVWIFTTWTRPPKARHRTRWWQRTIRGPLL